MAFEFKSLAAALGLTSTDASITDANLKQANDKIEQLERDKTGAEQKASTALADLATMTTRATTAEASLATATASLTEAKSKLATLEGWKKEQEPEDEREDDELNAEDEPAKPKSSFESIANKHINRMRNVHGAKKG